MNPVLISDVFKHHYQFQGDFCAASAHEFIMKLHGKLGLADFPLQSDSANEHEGFTFAAFLASYRFTQAESKPTSTADALSIMEPEVRADRYPLLAVRFHIWHVIAAVKDGNEIRLADPQQRDFITGTTSETSTKIQETIDAGGRPYLHLLTYS